MSNFPWKFIFFLFSFHPLHFHFNNTYFAFIYTAPATSYSAHINAASPTPLRLPYRCSTAWTDDTPLLDGIRQINFRRWDVCFDGDAFRIIIWWKKYMWCVLWVHVLVGDVIIRGISESFQWLRFVEEMRKVVSLPNAIRYFILIEKTDYRNTFHRLARDK